MTIETLDRPALAPDAPMAGWGKAAVEERVEALLEAVPAARQGDDIEGLHDLRVATRRLGAALRIFEPCFEGTAFRRLDRDARRVRRRSGALRDLDVLREFQEQERADLRGFDRLAMRYWLALTEQQWQERRRELMETLAWLEKRDLREEARQATAGDESSRQQQSPNGSQSGSVPDGRLPTAAASWSARPLSFRHAAPPLLTERYRDVTGYFPYVEHPEAETELHAMRIAVKRLRYAMEIFAPAFAGALKPELATARRLQDHLGQLHDSDVRRAMLAALIEEGPQGRALKEAAPATRADIVAGLPLLLAREEARRDKIYQEFRRQWRKLEAKSFPERLLTRLQTPDAPRE